MILKDSGLAREIRRAWSKMGGYYASQTGGRLIVRSPMWYVSCPLRIWPRKSLGTVVEHIGAIPEEGKPIYASKDLGPQYTMESDDAVAQQILVSKEVQEEASATPVAIRGMRIYQADSLAAYGVPEQLLEMLDTDVSLHVSGDIVDGMIRWAGLDDDDEIVLLTAARVSRSALTDPWEQMIWRTLETIDCREPGAAEG